MEEPLDAGQGSASVPSPLPRLSPAEGAAGVHPEGARGPRAPLPARRPGCALSLRSPRTTPLPCPGPRIAGPARGRQGLGHRSERPQSSPAVVASGSPARAPGSRRLPGQPRRPRAPQSRRAPAGARGGAPQGSAAGQPAAGRRAAQPRRAGAPSARSPKWPSPRGDSPVAAEPASRGPGPRRRRRGECGCPGRGPRAPATRAPLTRLRDVRLSLRLRSVRAGRRLGAQGGALPLRRAAARSQREDPIHAEPQFIKIHAKPPATYLYS